METHRLVLPGDLNHFGFLFGGRLLAWVDEASWIAASLDFPGRHFITKAMDEVVFRHRVQDGAILRIHTELATTGTTSVTYAVGVFVENADPSLAIFTTRVTLVNVDSSGAKQPVGS